MEDLKIPKDLLWDYEVPPDSLLWKLQRLADFFPLYGKDQNTVALLYQHLDQLKVDPTTKLLIEEYYQAFIHANR